MISLMFVWLYVVFMIFGILLYDVTPYFSYIDEIYPWLFLGLLIISRQKINKQLKWLFGIAGFYLIYSLYIKITAPTAVINDLIIEFKPWLTFFCVLNLRLRFTARQRQFLKIFSLCCVPVVILGGLLSTNDSQVENQLLVGSNACTAAMLVATSYYFFAPEHKRKVNFIFVLILVSGLIRPTSKYIIAFGLVLWVLWTTRRGQKMRIGFISVALLFMVGFIMYPYISTDFIMYYTSDQSARAILFITAGIILLDYLPFGPGLGTFASSASRNWYSPLYAKYHINSVWGLGANDVGNFTSDTYFPTLAQFGIVGVLLFFLWVRFVWIRLNRYRLRYKACRSYRISMVLLSFVLISSMAEATVIGHSGVMLMIILALALNHIETENCGEEEIKSAI